jgi:hypothetical protein
MKLIKLTSHKNDEPIYINIEKLITSMKDKWGTNIMKVNQLLKNSLK